MQILKMAREEILGLWPEHINRLLTLTKEEILHIFSTLGGFWTYDYEAAKNGKPGLHAELKSKRHSDGFLFSKAALQYFNICRIMARQLVLRWSALRLPEPDWVIGIPNGATILGEHVAYLMGAKLAEMVKEGGRIKMVSKIPPDETLLFVEDFCTKGTGFKEAVLDTIRQCPGINFFPYELVIINRGGLKEIVVDNVGSFEIVAAAEHRIEDWDPDSGECEPCKHGSNIIKPKATNENWDMLTNSQAT